MGVWVMPPIKSSRIAVELVVVEGNLECVVEEGENEHQMSPDVASL